jgi:hypothetical protein
LTREQVTASSQQIPQMGPGNLVSDTRGAFWHVSLPRKESPAWVAVDLLAPQPVALIAVRSRLGLPAQMWNGSTCRLEASNDALKWDYISTLDLDRKALDDSWRVYPVTSNVAYRNWRLAIYDDSFIAMGGLELFVRK